MIEEADALDLDFTDFDACDSDDPDNDSADDEEVVELELPFSFTSFSTSISFLLLDRDDSFSLEDLFTGGGVIDGALSSKDLNFGCTGAWDGIISFEGSFLEEEDEEDDDFDDFVSTDKDLEDAEAEEDCEAEIDSTSSLRCFFFVLSREWRALEWWDLVSVVVLLLLL